MYLIFAGHTPPGAWGSKYGVGQTVCCCTQLEHHEEGPCGGDRPEQPDPTIQGRDLQNFPDVSPTTAEAVLGEMVEAKTIGKGRNTKYVRN